MKKVLLLLCAVIATPAHAAAPDFFTAFFNRDEHNLARTWAVPIARKQTDVLKTAYTFMQTEDAEMLQPVFASNGFSMDLEDLEGAIADARRFSTIADLDNHKAELIKEAAAKAEAERQSRVDLARRQAEAEAQRERLERLARENGNRNFDNSRRESSGPSLFAPEPGGLSVHGSLGGGTGGYLSVGAMGRYGVPLAGGKFGNIGPELGVIYTGRNSTKETDQTSNVVYTSPDGEYKVTDYASRELRDRADLYSIAGLSYQTPSIQSSSGRKIVNFELGGRAGIGTADNRRIKKSGEREDMVNYRSECSTWYDSYGYSHTTCHDVPYWDKMSDNKSEVTESGQKTTDLFYTAFAAANIAMTESLSLRLEVERYFLDRLHVSDATVGRVGVQFKF